MLPKFELDQLTTVPLGEFIQSARGSDDMHERSNKAVAGRTVRGTMSSGGHVALMSRDCDMLVRNPAPDASPPGVPTGKICTVTISAGNRP